MMIGVRVIIIGCVIIVCLTIIRNRLGDSCYCSDCN